MAFALRMVGIHVKRGIKESGRKQTINIPLEYGKESKEGMIMVKVDPNPFER
jgi:hypothetical protein